MNLPNLDEKVYEYNWKVIFGPKDEWRNTMLHQILSDCHPGTFSKTKKKSWWWLWKSSILILQESLIPKKNPKALIGSQSTIEDLSFSHIILMMNNCTSILYRKILYPSLNTKCLPRHLRVEVLSCIFIFHCNLVAQVNRAKEDWPPYCPVFYSRRKHWNFLICHIW